MQAGLCLLGFAYFNSLLYPQHLEEHLKYFLSEQTGEIIKQEFGISNASNIKLMLGGDIIG